MNKLKTQLIKYGLGEKELTYVDFLAEFSLLEEEKRTVILGYLFQEIYKNGLEKGIKEGAKEGYKKGTEEMQRNMQRNIARHFIH